MKGATRNTCISKYRFQYLVYMQTVSERACSTNCNDSRPFRSQDPLFVNLIVHWPTTIIEEHGARYMLGCDREA